MYPAPALAYLFWTRHRLGLTLVLGLWLIVMIYCRAVPAGAFTLAADGSVPPALMVFVFLASGLVVAVGYLVVVFTFGREARLEACESGFPARLWTLPLPARALVGWPMLWGSATVMLGWVTLAWAAQRPCGIDVPLGWPSFLLAVVVAWLQAILWMPLPLPWIRIFLLIPVSYVLVFAPLAMRVHGVPSPAVSGLLAVLLLAAYLTAIGGVARARRGDTVQWGWPAWLRWPQAVKGARPFASAARAQLWFEWRLHGRAFPVAVAACVVIWLLILPLLTTFFDDAIRGGIPMVSPLLRHLGGLGLALLSLLAGMPLLASAFGIEMGKFGGKTHGPLSFPMTRPVSEVALVRAKFVAAAWSTWAGWGVLAVGLLLGLTLSGRAAEILQRFETLRQRHGAGLLWGRLVLFTGTAVLLTWLQMIQRLWLGLTGSARLMSLSGFSLAVGVGLLGLGDWLVRRLECGPMLLHLLPWLAATAVVLKSLAATWSLRALRRRELISPPMLWRSLLIWLTVAAGLLAALAALLPEDWLSWPGVVLGVVLVLPLTRLALAPLALNRNRHH